MNPAAWFQRFGLRTAAALTAAVVVGLAVTAGYLLMPVAQVAPEREVMIPAGSGAVQIAAILEREGIVRSRFGFSWFALATGRAQTLKAGRYLLCPCSSVPELVDAVASGRALSDDVVITIPEGMNLWEIDRLLVDAGYLGTGKRDAFPGAFAGRYSQNEGRYFPDTYYVSPDATFLDIADKMYATFLDRADGIPDEQLIVASILEKEAKTADDMALVAGIIEKRIELGMPLQIDATVAYGWCVRTAGYGGRPCDVTQAPIVTEIKLDGPYNTYSRAGLPEGPISNPGAKALQGAAHPKKSDYLYYLSTRDGSQLIFSETLDEHLKNRLKYLGF